MGQQESSAFGSIEKNVKAYANKNVTLRTFLQRFETTSTTVNEKVHNVLEDHFSEFCKVFEIDPRHNFFHNCKVAEIVSSTHQAMLEVTLQFLEDDKFLLHLYREPSEAQYYIKFHSLTVALKFDIHSSKIELRSMKYQCSVYKGKNEVMNYVEMNDKFVLTDTHLSNYYDVTTVSHFGKYIHKIYDWSSNHQVYLGRLLSNTVSDEVLVKCRLFPLVYSKKARLWKINQVHLRFPTVYRPVFQIDDTDFQILEMKVDEHQFHLVAYNLSNCSEEVIIRFFSQKECSLRFVISKPVLFSDLLCKCQKICSQTIGGIVVAEKPAKLKLQETIPITPMLQAMTFTAWYEIYFSLDSPTTVPTPRDSSARSDSPQFMAVEEKMRQLVTRLPSTSAEPIYLRYMHDSIHLRLSEQFNTLLSSYDFSMKRTKQSQGFHLMDNLASMPTLRASPREHTAIPSFLKSIWRQCISKEDMKSMPFFSELGLVNFRKANVNPITNEIKIVLVPVPRKGSAPTEGIENISLLTKPINVYFNFCLKQGYIRYSTIQITTTESPMGHSVITSEVVRPRAKFYIDLDGLLSRFAIMNNNNFQDVVLTFK